MTDLAALGSERLEAMAAAGDEVLECYRVLDKTGDNIVREVLPRDGTFVEFDHCPAGDVYDHDTHAQYYYHSHRSGEHGHFHTFLREQGMPEDCQPVAQSETTVMKERGDKLSHLVAISMNRRGFPIGIFTTNRWVTAENWYAAEDVCAMLDRFNIDHAQPSWATNRWIAAMMQLFRPQIVELIRERDAVVADWRRRHGDGDVFENRDLDLPSQTEISVEAQIRAVRAAVDACG